jgi:multidrug efflux pump subunit AcrA (membrane-fusion protein)
VLQDESGKPYAYVVAGGKAARVELKTGQDDGKRVEVLEGLKAGQQVVVEGNYELEDGMAVHPAAATP